MTGKTIKCNNCNASLDIPEKTNKVLCSYCGSQNFIGDVLDTSSGKLICLNCNTKNKVKNIYCDKCGLMIQYYCQFCSKLHPFNKQICPQKGVKFDINTTRDKEGLSALDSAIGTGSVDVVKALVSQGADVNARDKDGKTSLHRIALKGQADMVKLLISLGANVNAKDNNGKTYLHLASERKGQNPDIVKLLISLGANVNTKDNNGRTPLHLAAAAEHVDMVKLLISLGADVNSKDNDDRTPLHLVAKLNKVYMAKLLISLGADVNATGNDGRTPLNLATEDDHIYMVEALISSGASANDKKNLSNNENSDNCKKDYSTDKKEKKSDKNGEEKLKILISCLFLIFLLCGSCWIFWLSDSSCASKKITFFRPTPSTANEWVDKVHRMGKIIMDNYPTEEALSCCDKAIKLDPKYIDAYSTKAAILECKGRYKEAIDFCNKGLSLCEKPRDDISIGYFNSIKDSCIRKLNRKNK